MKRNFCSTMLALSIDLHSEIEESFNLRCGMGLGLSLTPYPTRIETNLEMHYPVWVLYHVLSNL